MSARSTFAVCALLLVNLLASCGPVGDLFATQPTPTPTRTRRPTATNTPLATDTPTVTATPVNTATFTPQPPTATFTQPPPTDTFTPAPPTATFTRRPPTATFTRVPPPPPTNTPKPAGPPCPSDFPNCITYGWVNPGQPFTENQCNFLNGTHIEGRVLRADGTPILGAGKTGAMHLWIKGDGGGVFANPGAYKQFPSENDGRWNAEFPKRTSDFEWHIFISAQLSDDPISADLWGVSSAVDKCGQPGSKNFFVVNWIVP